MMSLLKDLVNFFFPRTCVVCDEKLLDAEPHICISCLSQMPKTNFHKHTENRLEDIFAGKFPFQHVAAYAYFLKGGSVQKIIHEFKYKANLQLAQFMGELYGSDLKKSDFIKDIDILVPIPMHPKKQKKRGYNQAEEIAKGISKQTNVPINNSSLQKVVNNASQTKNSRTERWKNVENVFELKDIKAFKGKHILLIDDVITTGSTLEACALQILKCKDSKISIATIGAAS